MMAIRLQGAWRFQANTGSGYLGILWVPRLLRARPVGLIAEKRDQLRELERLAKRTPKGESGKTNGNSGSSGSIGVCVRRCRRTSLVHHRSGRKGRHDLIWQDEPGTSSTGRLQVRSPAVPYIVRSGASSTSSAQICNRLRRRSLSTTT